MKNTLNFVFAQASEKNSAVKLDTEESEAVVYMGLKFVKEKGEVVILSTETDLYREIDKHGYACFVDKEFNQAVKDFRIKRLERALKSNSENKIIKEKINSLK